MAIENGASLKSLKSISPPIDHESENDNSGGFDCNICLDSVQDPVITMCGHLYCWPCIYKWMHYQTEKSDHEQARCPVCKLEVSENTIVPLYGPGLCRKKSDEKATNLGMVIPNRPPTSRCTDTHVGPNSGTGREDSIPTVGMFSDMVYGNSYHLAGNVSPRVRRHIVEVNESLNRFSYFLICCMVLCLVLF